MSTRIGTLGAQQLYISRLLAIQTRMQDEQTSVTTGLKSTSYSGIAADSNSAINLENQKTLANQYLSDNAIANTKLDATSTTLTSIKTTINNMITSLDNYARGNTSDPQQVQALQQQAFNSMLDIQSYLGANVEGQYLFSGGRFSTMPVSMPATTLSQFQSMFNGSTTTYPTTRGGDLANVNLSATQTGAVSFDPTNGLIIPANAGGYSTVSSSAYVTVAGTSNNNGNYTVTGHPPTSSGGAMLSETDNIGAAATITYNGGASTLTNATTGNLKCTFNSAGQLIVTPGTANSLQPLATVGSDFTITGSDSSISSISAADTTALIGTNLYTYSTGSTSPSGITINGTDQFTVLNKATNASYTYQANTGANTVADFVNWLNTSTGGTVTAGVDNQGRINITNATAADFVTFGGAMAGLLGFNSTTPLAGGASTAGSPILDHANAQRLTTLQNGAGGALVSAGDTLTYGGKTLKVDGSTTLTDLTQWIQTNIPSAKASFSGGKLSITNGSGGAYTLTGTLGPKLGLAASPDTIAAGATETGTALPVVPGNYDGAYKVVAYNTDGTLVMENDTTPAVPETLNASKVGLASGMPPVSFGTGVTSGDATFTTSGDTVTLTLPTGGTNLTTKYAAGSAVTISGTGSHNGTYMVSKVTANTVSFQVNPDALRVSQLVPQTGRADVSMTFNTQAADTVANSKTNVVPGTVLHGLATLDKSVFGSLDYTPNGSGGEKISSSIPGAFRDTNGLLYPPAGTVITLKSTTGVNDGTYTVASNDGTNLVIKSNTLKTENGVGASTMTATSWYKGDTLDTQQRIDSNRQVDTGIFASDPAFEKAIRAMGILAQGSTGTAGGLENHQERVAAAQYLLTDAIQHTNAGTPPYGTEQTSDVTQLSESIGYTQSVISTVNDKHTAYIGFIDTRVTNIEKSDPTTAITTLLADSNALQASYQALARVSSLSLLNYLPNA